MILSLINIIKEKEGPGDKHIDPHEWVVEDDKVTSTWTAYFSDATFKGITLYIIKDDKILEEWSYYKMVID